MGDVEIIETLRYPETAEPRAFWGPGPWEDEPDRVLARIEGFHVLASRTTGKYSGHWCGYIGVEPGHPWHGKALDMGGEDTLALQPDVHWGITYAAECAGRVCHVPREGEPEHLWWVGFDCAHCDDLQPGVESLYRGLGHQHSMFEPRGIYRTLDFVMAELRSLAHQAARVARGEAPTGEAT